MPGLTIKQAQATKLAERFDGMAPHFLPILKKSDTLFLFWHIGPSSSPNLFIWNIFHDYYICTFSICTTVRIPFLGFSIKNPGGCVSLFFPILRHQHWRCFKLQTSTLPHAILLFLLCIVKLLCSCSNCTVQPWLILLNVGTSLSSLLIQNESYIKSLQLKRLYLVTNQSHADTQTSLHRSI